GVQQTVVAALGFKERDAQRRDALVERAALPLDRGANLQRTGGTQVISAPLRLLERVVAELVRHVEPIESEPDLGKIQRDHVLHHGVVAIDGYGEAALEVVAGI